MLTHLAVNDSRDIAPLDDARAQNNVEAVIAEGTEIQMLITTASLIEIEETIVDDGIRGVLDADAEGLGDVVGQRWLIGNLTTRSESRE